MPTMRRRIERTTRGRITAKAVEAFRAGDYHALQNALNLPPWHPSPLPESVETLGVTPDHPPEFRSGSSWDDCWQAAVELQRELFAAANGGLKWEREIPKLRCEPGET